MRLKCLALQWWMKFGYHRDLNSERNNSLPIFGRDGYYKLGDMVWFEVGGIAYQPVSHNFDYDLMLLEHNPLRRDIRLCLEVLYRERMLSEWQMKILLLDEQWWSIRSIKRGLSYSQTMAA